MSVYKFQVFITIDRNSLSIPKVFYDTTEINDLLNLINKDISNFVQNNFYRGSNHYATHFHKIY